MLSERSQTKGHIVYESRNTKCPQQASPQRQKADRVPWGGSRGEGLEIEMEYPFAVMKMS